MNTGIKILGFLATAFGEYNLSQLITTAYDLYIFISNARIHKLCFTFIVFCNYANLQKSTKTELNTNQNYVVIYAGDTIVTNTAISNSVIKIVPLEDTQLNTNYFNVVKVSTSELSVSIEKNTNKSKSNHQASKNAENKEISLDVLLYRRVTTIALLFINLLCIKKGACNLILGGLNCKTPSNAHNIKIL